MKQLILILFAVLLFYQVQAQYPTSRGGDTYYEHITNVSFSNVNNTTVGDDDDGDGYAGYDYFDDQIMYVNTGRTFTLSVTIHPDYDEFIYVWIDYNQNEIFESSELTIVTEDTDIAGPYTENITIPTSATTGLTRMRISLKWNTAPDSDEIFSYGEVEDYPINISKYNYAYLGAWDNDGVPDYLVTPGDFIFQETRDLIDAVLPESTPNLDYIDYNNYLNVTLDTGTRIWASFISEGAMYKNTFAMYNYPENDPPATENDIDSLTIIFPNVDGTQGVHNTGSLQAGSKVYYDSFPSGTVVAFALISRGFDYAHTNSTIDNQGIHIFYSNNNLNPESVDSLKAHNVTFWDSQQEKYILGFEDINRQNGGCDQDFNDVLFYITLDPIPIFDQQGGSNNQPPDIEDPEGSNLPVEWVGFEGKLHQSNVLLHWYVASQLNNDYFVVERSTDLQNYEAIGTVDGHGTTSQLIRYTFTDENPIEGEAYYRIKQVDFDGTYDYSKIISINYQAKNQFIALYPNPVREQMVSIRSEGLLGNIKFEVINSQGQLVHQEMFTAESNFTKRYNTESLPNGLYYIRLSDENNKLQKKLIVQH